MTARATLATLGVRRRARRVCSIVICAEWPPRPRLTRVTPHRGVELGPTDAGRELMPIVGVRGFLPILLEVRRAL
jgi:hypothetical protein